MPSKLLIEKVRNTDGAQYGDTEGVTVTDAVAARDTLEVGVALLERLPERVGDDVMVGEVVMVPTAMGSSHAIATKPYPVSGMAAPLT